MLDATLAGRAVYLPLGFRDVEPISRWRSPSKDRDRRGEAATINMALVKRTGLAVFGANRSAILSDFAWRPGTFSIVRSSGASLLSRAGWTVTQIGPVVGESECDTIELVDRAIEAIGGPLLIDILDLEGAFANLLTRRGFVVERPLSRMALGEAEGFGGSSRVRVIAGPEFG